MLRVIMLILFLLNFSVSFADTATNKIKYVIYMTFDGTRWQEIFLDRTLLKTFWEKYSNQVNIYGMPETNTYVSVASIPISLPSYQSQMTGAVQPCLSNECGRVRVKTFPENIKDKLHLQKQDVAVFASWYNITYAAEHIEGSIYTNTGNNPVYDPVTQVADSVMYDLNMQQFHNLLPDHARLDKYTYQQAIHYFETYKPRFLWISFNDSDASAHRGDLEGYQNAIRFFDYVLDEVFSKLKTMGIDDETMVIVTTDHGRGNGDYWTQHGARIRASKQTWAFVKNGDLTPISIRNNTSNYSTLSIRPTIEAAFGIA